MGREIFRNLNPATGAASCRHQHHNQHGVHQIDTGTANISRRYHPNCSSSCWRKKLLFPQKSPKLRDLVLSPSPVTSHQLPRRTELEKGQTFPSSPPPPPPPLLFLLNRSNYMYLPKPRQPTIATNDTAMPAAFSAPEIKAL